jgi:hypothetical protein
MKPVGLDQKSWGLLMACEEVLSLNQMLEAVLCHANRCAG